MGLWLGREREQKQLYFSTSTTLHEAPEQVPASLRIKLPGKRSYRSLLCHSIRCVENSTLLMTAKDTCLTFNWTALSTTRHLRNKGEVAKKRKIKKEGYTLLASSYPYSTSFTGRVWQQKSYSCVTHTTAKAALVCQPHCFWSYQNTISIELLRFAERTHSTLCQRLNSNQRHQ